MSPQKMSSNSLALHVPIIAIFLASLLLALPILAGDDLPPGIPRIVDTNGVVLFVESQFTTPAYQNEALQFIMDEASQVASELHLHESIPITRTNLTRAYICPFGYSYMRKCVGAGNIVTSNYWYFVKDTKLSDVTVTKIDERCKEYAVRYQIPIKQLDTNAAFMLATQWLAAAHMDVAGLNRDYDVRIDVDGYWNNVKMGDLPKKRFTPLYIVSWMPKDNGYYAGAYVQLFLPTKTLLDLSVRNPKYILRPSVTFTNLAALFPGKATIVTNLPKPISPLPVIPND